MIICEICKKECKTPRTKKCDNYEPMEGFFTCTEKRNNPRLTVEMCKQKFNAGFCSNTCNIGIFLTNKEEIILAISAEAVKTVKCPRCKSKKGNPCVSPKGVEYRNVHTERIKAYTESMSEEEFDKKHLLKTRRVSL